MSLYILILKSENACNEFYYANQKRCCVFEELKRGTHISTSTTFGENIHFMIRNVRVRIYKCYLSGYMTCLIWCRQQKTYHLDSPRKRVAKQFTQSLNLLPLISFYDRLATLMNLEDNNLMFGKLFFFSSTGDGDG